VLGETVKSAHAVVSCHFYILKSLERVLWQNSSFTQYRTGK